MIRTYSFAVVFGALLLIAGCGGNTSSVDSNGIIPQSNQPNQVNNGPSKGDLGVFVTDGISDKYDHVWVSIKKIDLKLAAGGTRTIFEDPQGVGVDLASLHDESGPRYRYINDLTLPAGTYTGATITLDKSAILFPTNNATGQSTAFAKQADGAKDATIEVKFDPPKLLGTGHDDLVFDFDLSKWSEEGGKLSAVVVPSLGAGLESSDRNSAVIERGTVEDLKGDVPAWSFTLKDGKLDGVDVVTSATTALIGLDTSAPAELKKGTAVEITGIFDTNTRKFNASSVRVVDPKAAPSAQVSGVVSSIDAKTGTWLVTPNQTRSMLPQAVSVPVSLSDHTQFFGASGLSLSKDDFFKGLSASKSVNVLVEGTYDSSKNTMLVGDARLLDADTQPAVKVTGLVGDPKTDDQTFGLTVSGYEGLLSKVGAGARVAITPTTTFVDESGKSIASDAFFASLATPKDAAVEGVLDTSTGNVLATTVKLSVAPVSATKADKKKIAAAAKIVPKKPN